MTDPETLRAALATEGATQRELSREVGITAQTMNTYCTGRSEPPRWLLVYMEQKAEVRRLRERLEAANSLAVAVRTILDWRDPE